MHTEEQAVLDENHETQADMGTSEHDPSGSAIRNESITPSKEGRQIETLSLDAIAPRADDILEAAKTLAAAAKKVEKNRADEEEAKQAAKTLQEEANEAFNRRLENHTSTEMRSFEEIQKDVLKALKKFDKAAESAAEETAISQGAYNTLLDIITPAR